QASPGEADSSRRIRTQANRFQFIVARAEGTRAAQGPGKDSPPRADPPGSRVERPADILWGETRRASRLAELPAGDAAMREPSRRMISGDGAAPRMSRSNGSRGGKGSAG